MEPQVAPLATLLDLNTDLLLNCLEGVTDTEARERLAGNCNSAAFLAAHLTDSRYFLAARIGRPLDNPLARFLATARSIDEMTEWPTLEEIRLAWVAVSEHLQTALGALSAADLAKPNAHRFPIPDGSQLGLIAFLVQHDSYHLGQAALLRRQLGKPPMSYSRARRQPTAAGA